MQPILIVDDDVELCDMLSEYLLPEGFAVTVINNGEAGIKQALTGDFQALVLDVMLPGLSGFEVLQNLRRSSRIPVIMLTAKGDDIDRILGLEMGADDYLPKPFNPRELVARLRAVLRRGTPNNAQTGAEPQVLEFGLIRLRPAARKAYFQDKELELTSTEFTILEILLRNAGAVVTKESLYKAALGRPLSRYDRSMDMHISHLRRKLSTSGTPGADEDSPIQTIRGTGYQLVEHGDQLS